MDGIETEFAQQWGVWLTAKLKAKGWKGADLRRALARAGIELGSTQMSRWTNGAQRPSVKSAGAVADVLGVERKEAWAVAGLDGDVGDAEGPAIIADPAEAFVEQIRARGFPSYIENRLVAEIRAEIEQRRHRFESELDTYQMTLAKTAESARAANEAGIMLDEQD